MRILRIRSGFQADHSSSSYLFYAVDQPVSAAGQRVAHRFSSRADVDEQHARYLKWGESSLSTDAFPALLREHYDVMASESYDSWNLIIAVPKSRQMHELLRPFHDLDDGEFVRLDVHDYGRRLAVEVFCEFDAGGPLWNRYEDPLEELVELLAEIRHDIMQGDVSFLEAVAQYYGAGSDEEDSADTETVSPPAEPPSEWTKARLQQECRRCGVRFRVSWTKGQLREALAAGAAPAAAVSRSPAQRPGGARPPKLSPAARRIVTSLERR
jgi:hypothetical protein